MSVDGRARHSTAFCSSASACDRIGTALKQSFQPVRGISNSKCADRAGRTLQLVRQLCRVRGQDGEHADQLTACAENIASTSRSSAASPSVMRRRCPISIGPSSGASGGDGIQSIRSSVKRHGDSPQSPDRSVRQRS